MIKIETVLNGINMNYFKTTDTVIDEETWERYSQTRDIGLRNEILMTYLYIVTCNIKKMRITVVDKTDLDDITSHGVLELINCIERYNHKRGIQFDSYASIRIRGSIIDYIRKRDWVPRDVRKRVKSMEDAQIFLYNQLGRHPEDKEVAAHLNISEKELEKTRNDSLSINVMAFEELLYENESKLLDNSNGANAPDFNIMSQEFKKTLADYIDSLEEKERTVISLYYYEELKLKEIAFVMGLTESRISQIHSKAITKLKGLITGYLNM
ncbi:MAG: sigma-70 family RNA polymerase sigma factor [Eubacteriales bacterium]